MTTEQMINKIAGVMAKMQGIPEDQAKEQTEGFITKLKRWQK